MIKAQNLTFSYDGKKDIFQNISFHVQKGEIMAVLGANGVGKTTMMRCIMRFLPLKGGEVYVNGSNVKKLSDSEFWERISYVPQAKSLVFGYSVLNMVVMGRSQFVKFGYTPGKTEYDRAYALLEEMGLAEFAHRSCNSLSGGQLQMVLIARALIKEPDILIMDEPESNLDMRNQLKVLEIMKKISKERDVTVIINTHYPEHALRYSDKTLILGKKSFVFDESKKAITKENIYKYFKVEASVYDVEINNEKYQGILPISYV
ncbi:MAG: ABC transporter ATP-binding protein [Lachnospiraceae bacterium]|nr:ABC transporter ATP-binding protein [Lachnospiraceae bacterium]